MSDSSFLAAILLFERGCLQLELSCCRTPHPYVEFFFLAQTVLSLKQERIDYQPRPQGAEASEKRLEDEVARLYQEPITVITHLAWSRRSDSRARKKNSRTTKKKRAEPERLEQAKREAAGSNPGGTNTQGL